LIKGSKQYNVLITILASLFVLLAAVRCNADGPLVDMVFVKGGCFQMGDTFGDGNAEEKPSHEVCVDDFSLGKYEVTQAQWQAVMGGNPSRFAGDARRPVDSVSWDAVQAFIARLNKLTGMNYRLPTEAEWEYAARSGGQREKYSDTSLDPRLGDYAWYGANSGKQTHAVGTRRPNRLGLHDMSGNVWEWIQDCYVDTWYGESPKDNPKGPNSGDLRVLRGGSWNNYAWSLRNSRRNGVNPEGAYEYLGFRLAVSAK
jgi:formylglycine-generating enzyme